MNRKFIAILLSVVVLFCFSACKSENENSSQDTTGTTGAQTTANAVTTTGKTDTTTQDQTTAPTNPFKDKMTITWLRGSHGELDYWDQAELEQRFNVDLEL